MGERSSQIIATRTKLLELRLHLFEHVGHLLVHQIDCLQWSNHDSELNNLSRIVARNDVDAVDVFPVDCGFKLENRCVSVQNLLGVAKPLAGI